VCPVPSESNAIRISLSIRFKTEQHTSLFGPVNARDLRDYGGALCVLSPEQQEDRMKNPLTELREQTLGLTLGEMAEALGVGYHRWYSAERNGAAVPHKARAALADLGIDVGDLLARQEAWLEARAAERRAELRQRLAAEVVA